MDRFHVAIWVMALTDSDWGARDTDGRRRVFTVEELDALTNWGWHWPGLLGVMAACANAVRSPWRPRASNRIESTRLPSAEATAHV